MAALINRGFTSFSKLFRGDLFLGAGELYMKLNDTTALKVGAFPPDRQFQATTQVVQVYYRNGRLG